MALRPWHTDRGHARLGRLCFHLGFLRPGLRVGLAFGQCPLLAKEGNSVWETLGTKRVVSQAPGFSASTSASGLDSGIQGYLKASGSVFSKLFQLRVLHSGVLVRCLASRLRQGFQVGCLGRSTGPFRAPIRLVAVASYSISHSLLQTSRVEDARLATSLHRTACTGCTDSVHSGCWCYLDCSSPHSKTMPQASHPPPTPHPHH